MNKIKRFTTVIVAVLTMTMLFNVSVSAKEIKTMKDNVDTEVAKTDVSHRASYYGYGWHNAGEQRTKEFTVSGTGSRMFMTLKVENFNSSTMIGVNVYNSNRKLLFNVYSWIGDNLSTGYTSEVKGSVEGSSYYIIEYTIIGLDSSGRVMAWTY